MHMWEERGTRICIKERYVRVCVYSTMLHCVCEGVRMWKVGECEPMYAGVIHSPAQWLRRPLTLYPLVTTLTHSLCSESRDQMKHYQSFITIHNQQ